MKRIVPAILAFLLLPAVSFSATVKPKYGPNARVLSREHEYFQKSAAPDFWSLIPYYLPQQDEKSCSLASVTMVVNAARSGHDLGFEDELATQAGLLKRVKTDIWKKGLGPFGRGVTLDQLAPLLEESLSVYGMSGAKTEVFHAPDASAATLARVREILAANEKSSNDFIVANFDQQVYTGDAQVGHIAPIAAYDAARDRVLVLDPDRKWYEPYWVAVPVFVQGMATKDPSASKNRGLVRVMLPAGG